MKNKDDILKLFNEFNQQKVLIIGDVMIDSYLWGNVERMSPEAPVPIVSVHEKVDRLGGAANVAMNIKALGATPIICSVIGNDAKGKEFINLLDQRGLSKSGIVVSSNRKTTTKFRIFGNKSQIIRVDEETTTDLSKDDFEQLKKHINDIFDIIKIDIIIFQDYDKGVINTDLIDMIFKKSRNLNIPVVVDPKKKNFYAYKNFDFFKPNLKELKEGLNLDFNHRNIDELSKAAQLLKEKINIGMIMITLSEDGVYISNDTERHLIPAHIRAISDVSGAGDTVISLAALCLALKLPPEEIAYISNIAGGLVCEEVGVVPINKDKLLKEIERLSD